MTQYLFYISSVIVTFPHSSKSLHKDILNSNDIRLMVLAAVF